MKIPIPTTNEKIAEIEFILNQGLSRKKGFCLEIKRILQTLGIKGVFYGVFDASFLAITIILILSCVLIQAPIRFLYTGLFLISPLSYMLLYSLVLWKEKLTGTWELKMTCLLTIRHLTAVRMLVFGAIGILTNTAVLTFLYYRSATPLPFFQLLGISFSSLFLFAVVTLWTMRRLPGFYPQVLLSIFWCGFSLVLFTFFNVRIETMFLQLPAMITLGFALFMILLFLWELRSYFFAKGDLNYAIN